MIALLSMGASSAIAGPAVVVTMDNGGFNLPLYTERWNGRFVSPSVLQQFAADVSRIQGDDALSVWTYLPPGPRAGRSSEPFLVEPAPGCSPGERCWDGLDRNRHPAASTSLYQAVTGVRRALSSGPRIEIHLTDLFEEDPGAVRNPSDADRCVTPQGTRKAISGILANPGGSLDHVAVGRLTAKVDAPREAQGSLTSFQPSGDGCWSATRERTFVGAGAEVAMGVLVLGIDTAGDDEHVRAVLDALVEQVSDPMALDLVTVREPATVGTLEAVSVPAHRASIELPPPLDRRTPCSRVSADSQVWSAGQPVPVLVEGACSDASVAYFPRDGLVNLFRGQAGFSPTVGALQLSGQVDLIGDLESVAKAFRDLPGKHPVADRSLPFWNEVGAALRIEEEGGVARGRIHRVHLKNIQVTAADDRPWLIAFFAALLPFLVVSFGSYFLLSRFAANRAFRHHLDTGRGRGRSVAAVLAEAKEEAQMGWFGRMVMSVVFGVGAFAVAFLFILAIDRARGG